MNTTQKLKNNIVEYMGSINPDPTLISVVDSKQREELPPFCLAVDVPSSEAHSVALSHVQRCDVTITLRVHAGDDPDADTENWIDELESSLNDPSPIKAALDDGIRIDHWIYNGSVQEWDEAMLEVSFYAQCLVAPI